MERRIWKFSKGASTGEPSLAGFGFPLKDYAAEPGKSGDGVNPVVVMAADSMLRMANRAQAGSRRLHGQAVSRGFGESVAFEA